MIGVRGRQVREWGVEEWNNERGVEGRGVRGKSYSEGVLVEGSEMWVVYAAIRRY